MAGSKNFTNIEKSLANHFARYECALNACEKHGCWKIINYIKCNRGKERNKCLFFEHVLIASNKYTVFPGLFSMDKSSYPKNVKLLLVKEFGNLQYIWIVNTID